MPWPPNSSGFFDFLKDAASTVPEGLSMIPGEIANQGYLMRYGKTKPEKEMLAWQQRPDPEMGYDEAQRYGAGRQFAENWGKYPGLVRGTEFIADLIHQPFDPETQKLAGQGREAGLQAYEKDNPNDIFQGGYGWGKW